MKNHASVPPHDMSNSYPFSTVKARALLDSASTTSFSSECMTQTLQRPKSSQSIKISGMSHCSPLHSVVSFDISISLPSEKIEVTAVVAILHVTSELPLKPVHLNASWSHLSDLHLADPYCEVNEDPFEEDC